MREGSANPRWAGDAVTKSGGRQRARKLFPGALVCEIAGCGKKAERHHKDDNTANNDPSNIAFLCHRHHVHADGRMSRPELRAAQRKVSMRPRTLEHRAKIGAAHLGMRRTDEARAAMSAAMKASYARRARPAYCPQGHAYDEGNTRTSKDGRRNCRACARARARRLYQTKGKTS